MSFVSTDRKHESEAASIRIFAEFLPAYLAQSPEMREMIHRMVAIVTDSEADEDDRVMALHTLYDVLFPEPSPYDGLSGIDLDDLKRFATGEMKEAFEELDREQTAFAERLRAAMAAKGMTLARLAETVGMDQAALAGLLDLQWRPQSPLVAKIAEVLGMRTEELWPAG